ncbi:response regulator transcription factor [Paenibacillus lautus]|uniref:response regulator n=1 Tax=Paenibacillus lautus TaxID=1401 RepID=UPI003D26A38A
MNNYTNVLLIDDHPAVVLGIKTILEEVPNVRVMGVAGESTKVIEMVKKHQPSVIFIEMTLTGLNSLEIIKQIKEIDSDTHIIIFTGYDYLPFFNKLIEFGVSGIINKDASPQKLISLFRSVLEGDTIIPLKIYRKVQLDLSKHENFQSFCLTKKEMELMLMVAKGWTNSQIAEKIYMSVRSVENYLSKIYVKMKVNSRTEAVEKIGKELSYIVS